MGYAERTRLIGSPAPWIAALALFAIMAAPAHAQPIRADGRARLIRVGHDGATIDSGPVQHITRVTALPRRDAEGRLYSFSTAYTAFAPDELKSWRLIFLAGKLTGRTFQIAGNSPDSITVTDLNGPLDNIAVGDPVMVESVIVRDIPLR